MRAVVGATSCAALAVTAVLGGCGKESSPAGSAADPTSGPPSSSSSGPTEPAGEFPLSDEPVTLDPAEFSVDITNRWWPMEPGTRWTYRETDEEGTELEVVVTVTSATKKLANGVTARVVRDSVTEGGSLVEDTFDWYAQDADGTIWYLGEDTAEFEDGEISSRDGSFEAGADGALPGVIMPGSPAVGSVYRQEYYAGEAEDQGEILDLHASASVPAGSYRRVLQTADTNALEPDVLEHKYYAWGVGPVLTVDVDGGVREELVSLTTVSAADAAAAGSTPLGETY
jgi:hypothetical protein